MNVVGCGLLYETRLPVQGKKQKTRALKYKKRQNENMNKILLKFQKLFA